MEGQQRQSGKRDLVLKLSFLTEDINFTCGILAQGRADYS